MRIVCQFSVKWHQQFSQSARCAGHQRCIQTLQPARRIRQTSKSRRKTPAPASHITEQLKDINETPRTFEPNLVVREYEQNVDNTKEMRRVDPNIEINTELMEVRAQMENLERELAMMKQGPFGPQSEFMQALPKDERQALLDALSEEGVLREDDIPTLAEISQMAEDIEEEDQKASVGPRGVTLRIPKKDQAYVRHFNSKLKKATEANGDVEKNLDLWTWYLRCQQQIHNFSAIISNDVWATLWKTQADLKARPKHVVMLARDMLKAEEPLHAAQRLQFIEALHASGDTATALDVWQREKDQFKNISAERNTYNFLGVTLFAALGRPQKAQELAYNAISSNQVEPDVLVPVIIAWAKSHGPEAMAKAWACYLKLRELLGDQNRPELFEEISNAFLDSDCADMALNVFKDMLLQSQNSTADSQAIYRQATQHIQGQLNVANTEEQINRVGLSALLALPRQFHNRFFFASWIKKLIGEHRIDAALVVVELMHERGIVPDARPLNGIIGALLRQGSVVSIQRAEKLTTSMIEARREYVLNRAEMSVADTFRKVVPASDLGHLRRAVFLRRRLPAATIETFSILLQHYTRRSMFPEAEKLTNTMVGACQIKPNSFIMNHWLFADLRAGKLEQMWLKYRTLSQTITPDLETFAALWDAAKQHTSQIPRSASTEFPSARQLFAEMMAWAQSLPPAKHVRTVQEWSPDIFEQITRCFCVSMDLPGSLVAFYGLYQTFEAYPDDNSVRLVGGLAARQLPKMTGSHSRRAGQRNKHAMAHIGDIIDHIGWRKRSLMVETGTNDDDFEDPESIASKQLRLRTLTEFMCLFMQKKQMDADGDGSYQSEIDTASKLMRVDMSGVDLTVSEE